MPQEIDKPCFTARREAQKEAEVQRLVDAVEVSPLYLARSTFSDPVGAATAAQATHEATVEGLRRERDEAIARAESAESWGSRAQLKAQLDLAIAEFNKLVEESETGRCNMRALERLYARAIDAQVTAERARDDARAECQRLLEENRALRNNRDEWKASAETAWDQLGVER